MKLTKSQLRKIIKEEITSLRESDTSEELPRWIKSGFKVNVPFKFDINQIDFYDDERIRHDLEDRFGTSLDDRRKFEKKVIEDIQNFLDIEYLEGLMNF